MGKLLEALKKKNIDLNQSSSYKERYLQNQAKPLILEYFNKLPEEKRYELLNSFLSEKAKATRTKEGFVSMIHKIKDQGKEASRQFLTNSGNFGRPWQEVVPHLEKRIGANWTDVHYREEGVGKDSPAEDKAVALFRCQTYGNRMDNLWEFVDDRRKKEYQSQFLNETTKNPNVSTKYLNTEGVFAEGKDWNKFAEAVENSLDEASLNEMEQRIGVFKDPDPKVMTESLRNSVSSYLSSSKDKKRFMMQNAMLIPDAELDPDELIEKADRSKWHSLINPLDKAKKLSSEGKLNIPEIVERSKRIINDAEKKDDIRICKEAALQNYRNLKLMAPEMQSADALKAMDEHAAELQADLVRTNYQENAKKMDEGREMINQQIATIEKEKSGLFLSKKNTPEHDRMTKALRLFNAKLDMVTGKETAQKLTAEELETVKNSDIKALFDEAKNATFNYSCLKTKYGKGSIVHDDGKARNRAARNTYDLLNQLGNRLGLSSKAEELKDVTALEVLKSRGNKDWEKFNAEDCAAKTIYAMSLIHGGASEGKQAEKLSYDSLESSMEDIKKSPAFRQMVKDLGPSGLCEAIVKGNGALTLAYANAAEKIANPQLDKANQGKPPISAQKEHDFWNKKGDPAVTNNPQGPVA